MAWEPQQRRVGSLVVLGLSVAIVLGGIAVWYFVASTPDWVYWTLVGALALVLVFMLVLMFAQPRSKVEAPPAEAAAAAPATDATAAAAPAQAIEPRILTLRCGDCGTIFDVTDTGERPLYHTCPGCGAEGALREPVEPPAAAAEAEPTPPPPPPGAYAPPSEYSAPPVVSEAPPASAAEPVPVKKLKLRCGGCKEVFSIEDTGERPLKRACPHCGRIGKIG